MVPAATRRPIPWIALACLLLAGCAGPGAHATPPRVSLVGLAPVDIELLEQRYRVRMRVQNPNDAALRIRGIDYAIEINGEDFASGVNGDPVTIPAYGERTVDLVVTSSLRQLLEQFRALGESAEPRIRYRLHGGIKLEGVPGRIPFDHADAIDLGDGERRGRSDVERSI